MLAITACWMCFVGPLCVSISVLVKSGYSAIPRLKTVHSEKKVDLEVSCSGRIGMAI